MKKTMNNDDYSHLDGITRSVGVFNDLHCSLKELSKRRLITDMYKDRTPNSKDDWRTPQLLFDQLNARFNFTIDAACSQDNCLVLENYNIPLGFDETANGLVQSWESHRVFCNPPFSNKAQWMKKMYEEVMHNDCPLVVMILPMCLDTKGLFDNSESCLLSSDAFNTYVHPHFHWEHLPKRISFCDENNNPIQGNTSGTIIVYAMAPLKL